MASCASNGIAYFAWSAYNMKFHRFQANEATCGKKMHHANKQIIAG